jgi:hypothetical protein
MSAYDACDAALAANATIAINTGSSPQEVDGVELDVRTRAYGALYLYAKGDNANCAAEIDFYFQRSPDGESWHDLEKLSVAMDGTDQVTDSDTTVDMDLRQTRKIRLHRVGNNATVAGRTCAVNAYVQFGG